MNTSLAHSVKMESIDHLHSHSNRSCSVGVNSVLPHDHLMLAGSTTLGISSSDATASDFFNGHQAAAAAAAAAAAMNPSLLPYGNSAQSLTAAGYAHPSSHHASSFVYPATHAAYHSGAAHFAPNYVNQFTHPHQINTSSEFLLRTPHW